MEDSNKNRDIPSGLSPGIDQNDLEGDYPFQVVEIANVYEQLSPDEKVAFEALWKSPIAIKKQVVRRALESAKLNADPDTVDTVLARLREKFSDFLVRKENPMEVRRRLLKRLVEGLEKIDFVTPKYASLDEIQCSAFIVNPKLPKPKLHIYEEPAKIEIRYTISPRSTRGRLIIFISGTGWDPIRPTDSIDLRKIEPGEVIGKIRSFLRQKNLKIKQS